MEKNTMLAVFAFLLLLGMSSSSPAPSEFFLIERKEMRCFQVRSRSSTNPRRTLFPIIHI